MHMRLTSKNRFLEICFKSSDLGIFHDALPCDYSTIRPGLAAAVELTTTSTTGNIAQILKKMAAHCIRPSAVRRC